VFEALQAEDVEEYEEFDDDFITGMLNEGKPMVLKEEKKTVRFAEKKQKNMMVVEEEQYSEGGDENAGVEVIKDEMQEKLQAIKQAMAAKGLKFTIDMTDEEREEHNKALLEQKQVD